MTSSPTAVAAAEANERALVYAVQASRLEGTVRLSGAKNSVLRLMAASLLTEEPVRLRNYPATLRDAEIHRQMLERLGKRCTLEGPDSLLIEEVSPPPGELVWEKRSIRNTLLIMGALAARTGHGAVPMPGGCKLGDRKYDLHIMLLQNLGARTEETEERLAAQAPAGGLRGARIVLPMRSTGATENALISASLARGKTVIWGPHIRPEIMDLISMLRQMGAGIEVFGQERIEVEGRERLGGADHRVLPDNMEALTWMIGATMTGGAVEIVDFPIADLEVPLAFLKESGVRFYTGTDSVIVQGGACFPVEIATGPYPGINSDMQPLFAVFGAMSRGESKIIDLRFPGRYGYAEELAKMGVDAETRGDVLHVFGNGGALRGADVRALDLRAGIALTLCGLRAEGVTRVHEAWQVERGYDRFVDKLRSLGGRIEVGEG
ncbi:MAG: UDP-N-acetylglucosamine 1-carboxyvinyltransferase [Pseudomonadota bacterium]|nr:UDP-N-acetylglucosamine 1-carboxyvinyltransferase [Pseudomonadota bacterium]